MDILKTIHMTTALVSISGFTVRGYWMLKQSERLQRKWVKVVPHINDTVLLVSAVFLSLRLHQYPFVNSWLTAKLLALLCYIGLGMVALRFGVTLKVRAGALTAAILTFVYIVGVAVSRDVAWGL